MFNDITTVTFAGGDNTTSTRAVFDWHTTVTHTIKQQFSSAGLQLVRSVRQRSKAPPADSYSFGLRDWC